MATITAQAREQVCEWLRACGINPNDVPEDSYFRAEHGERVNLMHYRRIVFDHAGQAVLGITGDLLTVDDVVPLPDVDPWGNSTAGMSGW